MLIDDLQFQKALRLSDAYYKRHPGDLYAGWILAQALYHTGKYERSKSIYREVIRSFPEQDQVELDFGIRLVMMGDLEEAISLLNSYLDTHPSSDEARMALARASFWQGKFDRATIEVRKVMQNTPGHPEALSLYQELEEIQATRLELGSRFQTDDQPLNSFNLFIQGSTYLSSRLSLTYGLETPFYYSEDDQRNAQNIQFGSRFNFNKLRTILHVEGGIVKLPDGGLTGTGAVSLKQNIIDHLQFRISAIHHPYLHTVASLSESTLRMDYQAFLGWQEENGWLGEVGGQVNQFYQEDNWQYNLGGWIMTPPWKISLARLRFGYGFNYSNTRKDRFESVRSLEEIESMWNDSTDQISGIYSPYFTPMDQKVHSAILSMKFKISQELTIGLQSKYGISATIMQPYLFLNEDEIGNNFIDKDFYKEDYTHIEAHAFVDFPIAKDLKARVDYRYTQSIFYTSHSARLVLVKLFK
ncbi:MAG: tetratricopeptide repeat protein [Saprospiraceae bacterium]|nr:tetratricopeptide repeat protein [Saprospiraceae bacterium]